VCVCVCVCVFVCLCVCVCVCVCLTCYTVIVCFLGTGISLKGARSFVMNVDSVKPVHDLSVCCI